VTDPAGRWRKHYTDSFGNLIQVEQLKPGTAVNYTTNYSYDLLNRLRTVSMPRDGTTQTRTWTYDTNGKLTSVSMPEKGTTSYNYNADGTLLRRTDAKGQKVEYFYDALGRVSQINRHLSATAPAHPCQSMSFGYDVSFITGIPTYPLGRLTRTSWGNSDTAVCTEGSITEDYAYTTSGVPRVKKMTIQRLGATAERLWEQGVNNEGAVTYEFYPSGVSFNYAYDAMQRPSGMNYGQLLNGSNQYTTLVGGAVSYNAAGQLLTKSFPGYNEARFYNSLNQLTGIHGSDSVLFMNTEYRYSATANDGRIEKEIQSCQWRGGQLSVRFAGAADASRDDGSAMGAELHL